jgi:hypothetical protein
VNERVSGGKLNVSVNNNNNNKLRDSYISAESYYDEMYKYQKDLMHKKIKTLKL